MARNSRLTREGPKTFGEAGPETVSHFTFLLTQGAEWPGHGLGVGGQLEEELVLVARHSGDDALHLRGREPNEASGRRVRVVWAAWCERGTVRGRPPTDETDGTKKRTEGEGGKKARPGLLLSRSGGSLAGWNERCHFGPKQSRAKEVVGWLQPDGRFGLRDEGFFWSLCFWFRTTSPSFFPPFSRPALGNGNRHLARFDPVEISSSLDSLSPPPRQHLAAHEYANPCLANPSQAVS